MKKYVTSCINELVGKAMESKDHITVRFLDWFIQEQLEEEELFNEILSKIKMLGNGKLEGRDLYIFDGIMADFDSKKHSASSNEQ